MGYANFWPGGNGCVFYLDYENWQDDEQMEEDLEQIVQEYVSLTPSFHRIDGWYDSESRIMAESRLFYLCWTDNHWSTAISLLPKGDYPGLERRHLESFKKGLQEVLLKYFSEIRTYGGPYTSIPVSRT